MYDWDWWCKKQGNKTHYGLVPEYYKMVLHLAKNHALCEFQLTKFKTVLSVGQSALNVPCLFLDPIHFKISSISFVASLQGLFRTVPVQRLAWVIIIATVRSKYICYARSMDLRNPGIVLRKPWIHGLYHKPWIDRAILGLRVRKPWIGTILGLFLRKV